MKFGKWICIALGVIAMNCAIGLGGETYVFPIPVPGPEDVVTVPTCIYIELLRVGSNPHAEIYIENLVAPEREKEWRIVITPPPDATTVTLYVDYSFDENHQDPFFYEQVPMEQTPDGKWYADTWESQWAMYGTDPVPPNPSINPNGDEFPELDVGNPRWVSFHIETDGTPPIPKICIEDWCVPEPASLSLLALGAVALIRRRK